MQTRLCSDIKIGGSVEYTKYEYEAMVDELLFHQSIRYSIPPILGSP